MAFRQPQPRPQTQRQHTPQHLDSPPQPSTSQQKKRPFEEPRDWVVFAPPSYTDTSLTARTADLSRASYFGSLDTGVRSELLGSDDHILRQITADHDDDATELDSLDDGLQAFEEPHSAHLDQSGTVLPAHDGLGGFPTSFSQTGKDMIQEQMWQHERYNPQRRFLHRRLSSVQRRLDALDNTTDAQEIDPQEERRLRVERWRTEQSKAVLEEIERETCRRYKRMTRTASFNAASTQSQTASTSNFATSSSSTSTTTSSSAAEPESFWQRITRTVIRDLMGLDSNTLSVIFGEDLPSALSTTPTPDSPLHSTHGPENWEERLLSRIARELNVLVYQLSELESAFDTYNSRHTRPTPTPRMAPIPESRPPAPATNDEDNLFHPTLPADASLWGIDDPSTSPDPGAEHWEQHPSFALIVSYLRSRLRPAPVVATAASQGPLPAEWAASSRAEVIRRHHPLVSRAMEKRAQVVRRGSSSCASQSTKRSKGTGASRRYWELGGSVSGSGVSSGAGVGWGEV